MEGQLEFEFMAEIQNKFPRDTILEYFDRICDLMKTEGIPPSYSGSSSERAIFVYNTEFCEEWVQVYMEFKGKYAAMRIHMKKGGELERKLREIVPLDENGVVQNVEEVAT